MHDSPDLDTAFFETMEAVNKDKEETINNEGRTNEPRRKN